MQWWLQQLSQLMSSLCNDDGIYNSSMCNDDSFLRNGHLGAMMTIFQKHKKQTRPHQKTPAKLTH